MEVNIMDFIAKECLWLIPVLMMIGVILKQIPTNILPDWCIPISLYIIGMVLGYFFVNANSVGVFQGLLCATASIGLHQGIKQPLDKKK